MLDIKSTLLTITSSKKVIVWIFCPKVKIVTVSYQGMHSKRIFVVHTKALWYYYCDIILKPFKCSPAPMKSSQSQCLHVNSRQQEKLYGETICENQWESLINLKLDSFCEFTLFKVKKHILCLMFPFCWFHWRVCCLWSFCVESSCINQFVRRDMFDSSKRLAALLHFMHLIHTATFLMRTYFVNVRHKNVEACTCEWEWESRAGAKKRSLLLLSGALMEGLLMYPFRTIHPYRAPKYKCLRVCPQYTSFMTSMSKPQGLQFSAKTLIWSDRTASGTLLRGDLHCGGDPRVLLLLHNNRKKDL